MRGIERRLEKGLDPERGVGGIVIRESLGCGREGPGAARAAQHTRASPSPSAPTRPIASYSPRSAGKSLLPRGRTPQRLLWASTGTKDPAAPDTLYIEALAAPDTVNTMPDKTVKAFADHGKVGTMLSDDGGDCRSGDRRVSPAGHR